MFVIRVYYKLLPILLFGILTIIPSHGKAQRNLGVQWDVPNTADEAIDQLERFREIGISSIELDTIVSQKLWEEMETRGFRVYVQVPVRFPIVNTFSRPNASLLATYREFTTYYTGRNIEAFGVFEYGQTNRSAFREAISPVIDQLQTALSAPIYFKTWSQNSPSVDNLFDFRMDKIQVGRNFLQIPDSNFVGIRGFLYRPSPSMRQLVSPLKWFLEKTAINPRAVLFFESGWLLNFVESHPAMDLVLLRYATQSDPVFPLPNESLPVENKHSGIVLALLIIWGSFALNYSFEPTYRRSLFRYFFSHNFFIEDVMERHIRSIVPNLIVLGQHALMGGIFLYITTSIFLSDTGIRVLASYFPALNVFGANYFVFFVIGTVCTAVLEIVCLFWLYIAARKSSYFSQITILYSWPLHVNLITITILVTLMMSGGNVIGMLVFLLLFLVVFIAALPLAALDSGQFLPTRKGWYLAGTIGLYAVLIGGGLFLVLNSSYLMNIFRLASSIS